MLHHPRALFGLSDGGAHVGTICDASFQTFLLTHWARDRAERRMPIEKAVRMLTAANAEWVGFEDRGVLAPGKKADVNVIDLAALVLRIVFDRRGMVADRTDARSANACVTSANGPVRPARARDGPGARP
jgi:N-acyl-D-aspartate/D-glutamate deacylase